MDYRIENFDIENEGLLTNREFVRLSYLLRRLEKTEYDCMEFLECMTDTVIEDSISRIICQKFALEEIKGELAVLYNVKISDLFYFSIKLIYSTRRSRNKNMFIDSLK